MCEVRTETRYFNRAECLVCGHQDKVYDPFKEEYQVVTSCPKLDMFKQQKCKFYEGRVWGELRERLKKC